VKVVSWGEEGKKLFIFQKNVYLNSSLALDAEKKRYSLKSLGKMAVTQLHNAAVAV